MKLASLKTGGRDGSLIVVSRDLEHYVSVAEIAPTLQAALDDWQQTAPRLNARYAELNTGTCSGMQALDVRALASPFPRAYEFVDGSAYLPHVERVRKARGAEVPESFYVDPLMYQATSAGFLGPRDPVPGVSEDYCIDF
jgi:fumarylacetoacetate (FAA) hydrolase